MATRLLSTFEPSDGQSPTTGARHEEIVLGSIGERVLSLKTVQQ